MQNEKKSGNSWKETLETAEHLPVQWQLNKDRAWGRLQERLQPKQRRKKAVVYWVAAACAIPFLAATSLFLWQHKSDVTETSVEPLAKRKTVLKPAPLSEKETTIVFTAKPSESEKKKAKKTENKRNNIGKMDTAASLAFIDSTQDNQTLTAVAITDSVAQTTPPIVIAKRKLPVVHNNELEAPTEAAPVVAHNFYFHSFPLQLAKEETYSKPLQNTNKVGFISLKTKSSPN